MTTSARTPHHRPCRRGGVLPRPPRDAFAFLRNPSAKSFLPYGRGRTPPLRRIRKMVRIRRNAFRFAALYRGRTEASAPTRRIRIRIGAFQFPVHIAGPMWSSAPTEILRIRHHAYKFAIAPCAGGASPSPTLRRKTQKRGRPRPSASLSHCAAICSSSIPRTCAGEMPSTKPNSP